MKKPRLKRKSNSGVQVQRVVGRLELTDEMKALAYASEHPEDLNDALLAVHVEESAHALAQTVQRAIEAQIRECL